MLSPLSIVTLKISTALPNVFFLISHNPPWLRSSCSPQSGAPGRDLLRRDLGALGAHEGRPHPLQPAVHDGKLGLQAGTASFDFLLSCAAATLLATRGVTASRAGCR